MAAVTPLRRARPKFVEATPDAPQKRPREPELGAVSEEKAPACKGSSSTAGVEQSNGEEQVGLTITRTEGGEIEFQLDGQVYRVADEAAFMQLVSGASKVVKPQSQRMSIDQFKAQQASRRLSANSAAELEAAEQAFSKVQISAESFGISLNEELAA
mmetsp:Transcript_64847/g.104777  ORF Transcript_64847/g.104777 Transcript_64847/m.104777 type:complete len:157 (-) Transcript_64847:71-541(-)